MLGLDVLSRQIDNSRRSIDGVRKPAKPFASACLKGRLSYSRIKGSSDLPHSIIMQEFRNEKDL
jgi:hypothetical protein